MKSKKGDTIAFVVLDDKSGRFEASVFAKEYDKYRELLHKDAMLVVECQVSEDDYSGGMRGRVKEIHTLQDFRLSRARRLTICLDAELLTAGFCEDLAAILAPYRLEAGAQVVDTRVDAGVGSGQGRQLASADARRPGCLVVVQYRRQDSEGCIIFGHQWTVAVHDDLLQRLKSEFGKHRVAVQY